MQKPIKILLLLFLFINFIYVLSGVVNFPIFSLDTVSIWLLKAKIFYIEGISPLSNLNEYPYSHPQYPILLPLLFSYVYRSIGSINEIVVLMIYPFIYLLILFTGYKLLRKLNLSINMSLLLIYIYSMLSPLLAAGGRGHAGEADIFLVLINWMILYLVFNYLKFRNFKYLIAIVLLVILASQIKTEGVLAGTVFLFLPMKLKTKLMLSFLAIIPTLLWQLIVRNSGIVPDFGYTLPGIQELFGRIISILYFTGREFLNYRNWYIFWPLFFMVLLYRRKKKDIFYKTLQGSLLIMISIFGLNYLFSTIEPQNYVTSSIDRVLMQLSPLIFTLFTMKLKPVLNEFDKVGKFEL